MENYIIYLPDSVLYPLQPEGANSKEEAIASFMKKVKHQPTCSKSL